MTSDILTDAQKQVAAASMAAKQQQKQRLEYGEAREHGTRQGYLSQITDLSSKVATLHGDNAILIMARRHTELANAELREVISTQERLIAEGNKKIAELQSKLDEIAANNPAKVDPPAASGGAPLMEDVIGEKGQYLVDPATDKAIEPRDTSPARGGIFRREKIAPRLGTERRHPDVE